MKSHLAILLLSLTACATNLPRALDKVQTGMDKDQVLETAGNPKRTYREASQDHWIYVYFVNDHEFDRDVVFEDGKVIQISRESAAKEAWVKGLENAKTMEEYEQKARAHQQQVDEKESDKGK